MIKPLLLLLLPVVSTTKTNVHAADTRDNYFFFQLAPNFQSPLQVAGCKQMGIERTYARGLTFDVGYSVKISEAWNVEAGVGGNMFHYDFKLRSDERPGNIGERTSYALKGEYPFGLSIYLAPTYRFHMGNTGPWRAGAGLKMVSTAAVRRYAEEGYPNKTMRSNMDQIGGNRLALIVFLQKQIIPAWNRLETGLVANINFTRIGVGTVYDASGMSTADFNGNSLAVNIRYSLN